MKRGEEKSLEKQNNSTLSKILFVCLFIRKKTKKERKEYEERVKVISTSPLQQAGTWGEKERNVLGGGGRGFHLLFISFLIYNITRRVRVRLKGMLYSLPPH